jgi:uncharacterized protein (TIGR02266 family)
MDASDRRRDRRIPLVLRVEEPGSPEPVRGITENLSASGLFVRTERDLAEGARLPLILGFPGLLEPVEIEVEVVRRRPATRDQPAGVAVTVPADRAEDRARLAELLARVEREAEAARPARVLVVDDNPHVLELYGFALGKLPERDRVEAELASNVPDALERLRRDPPIDVLLTDLFMPGADGFALIEAVRGDPALARLPVVVLSAGGAEARRRAEALGADLYLQKPVRFADLVSTVRRLVAG